MLGGRICANCGHRNASGARFCDRCGESLQPARQRPGCLRRSLTTLLAIVAGVVLLSLLLPGGCGLSLDRWLPVDLGGSPDAATTATPAPPADGTILQPVAPGESREVSYTVTADPGASPLNVTVDYLDADGRPVHAAVSLPWQQSAQLASGAVARLVAQADAGQAFTARIYVGDELRVEAEAGQVAGEVGAPAIWRAQAEAQLAP